MGSVTDLNARRRARAQQPTPTRQVTCAHCAEPHPVVRLAGGDLRCVTAFSDHGRWFCRNRGCRAAWLAQPPLRS